MWGPILTLVGAGLVAFVALAFWAEIQNWLAGVIERARAVLGPLAHDLQSALVVLDRVMVNGQRMIAVTGRVAFQKQGTDELTVREEVRQMDPQALPADILARLDRGQSLTYDVS